MTSLPTNKFVNLFLMFLVVATVIIGITFLYQSNVRAFIDNTFSYFLDNETIQDDINSPEEIKRQEYVASKRDYERIFIEISKCLGTQIGSRDSDGNIIDAYEDCNWIDVMLKGEHKIILSPTTISFISEGRLIKKENLHIQSQDKGICAYPLNTVHPDASTEKIYTQSLELDTTTDSFSMFVTPINAQSSEICFTKYN